MDKKSTRMKLLVIICIGFCFLYMPKAHGSSVLNAARDGDYIFIQNAINGDIICFQADKPVSAASLIKLFIMIEAFKAFGDGRLDQAVLIRVLPDDQVGGAGSLQHLREARSFSWMHLVKLMIQESDNTATNILIRELGMAAINATAGRLGCNSTVLARMMMDTQAQARGLENLTTARDVGRLLALLQTGQCLDEASDRTMLELLSGQTLCPKLALGLPAKAKVFNKTAELVLSNGAVLESDAGIISGPGGSIIMVVICQGSPRGRARIGRLGRLAWDQFQLGQASPVLR
jgi:beta-lactamase class A